VLTKIIVVEATYASLTEVTKLKKELSIQVASETNSCLDDWTQMAEASHDTLAGELSS